VLFPIPAPRDSQAPTNLADSRQATADYLAAFECALERAPAPLRHSEMDALEEELSWLDSRGASALLASLGTPQAAAKTIILRGIAAGRLRRRRRLAVVVAAGAGIVGVALLVSGRPRAPSRP
jgi:hypothetical protein